MHIWKAAQNVAIGVVWGVRCHHGYQQHNHSNWLSIHVTFYSTLIETIMNIAETPAVKEPSGLCINDDKRPDGMTLFHGSQNTAPPGTWPSSTHWQHPMSHRARSRPVLQQQPCRTERPPSTLLCLPVTVLIWFIELLSEQKFQQSRSHRASAEMIIRGRRYDPGSMAVRTQCHLGRDHRPHTGSSRMSYRARSRPVCCSSHVRQKDSTLISQSSAIFSGRGGDSWHNGGRGTRIHVGDWQKSHTQYCRSTKNRLSLSADFCCSSAI